MGTPRVTIVGVETPCAETYSSGRRRGQSCDNPSRIRIDGVPYCGLHARSAMIEYGAPSIDDIIAMAGDAELACKACSRLYATHTLTQGDYGWNPVNFGEIGNEVDVCETCYKRYTRCHHMTHSPTGDVEMCNEQATHPFPRIAFGFDDEGDDENGMEREDELADALYYCEAHYQIALAERQEEVTELEKNLAEYRAEMKDEYSEREKELDALIDRIYPRIVERLRADRYLK